MEWTADQQKGLDIFNKWNREGVLKFCGVAGSRKTTVAKHIAENEEGVVFLTPTNKAKKTFERDGYRAQTVHSFVCNYEGNEVSILRRSLKALRDLRGDDEGMKLVVTESLTSAKLRGPINWACAIRSIKSSPRRNATRQAINSMIRQNRGFKFPLPQVGERLLAMKNSYDSLNISNGDILDVKELYEMEPDGDGKFLWSASLMMENEFTPLHVLASSAGSLGKEHPLKAKVGETVRIFFGNAGPNCFKLSCYRRDLRQGSSGRRLRDLEQCAVHTCSGRRRDDGVRPRSQGLTFSSTIASAGCRRARSGFSISKGRQIHRSSKASRRAA